MATLEACNIAFSYNGDTNIFEGLSFSVHSEETLCILGPNGTGKSTLMKVLMNLYPISQGKITLDGREIGKYKPNELAKRISFIPQNYHFAFPYKVLDIVLMGRTPYLNKQSTVSDEDYNKAISAIEELDLQPLMDRPCTQLSGGQLQLVMLARAMTQEAEILLLDEPTSHLDYGKQQATLQIISNMKKRKFGIIMTSHNPDHAFQVCDKVAIMNHKGFVAFGNPEEVITEKNLEDIYGIKMSVLAVNGRKICVPQ